MHQDIIKRAYVVFQPDVDALPPLTLRGGDAVDSYAFPPPYDALIDQPEEYWMPGALYRRQPE